MLVEIMKIYLIFSPIMPVSNNKILGYIVDEKDE
jgi:hypothetical protein